MDRRDAEARYDDSPDNCAECIRILAERKVKLEKIFEKVVAASKGSLPKRKYPNIRFTV